MAQWKIQDTNATTALSILILIQIVTHSENTLKYRRPLIHLNSVHKCKLTGGGHLAAILVIRQSPYSNLGESLIKVIYIYEIWLQSGDK